MGTIQSNIGLITGTPIGETVTKLMELAAKPRNMLAERTKTLQEEQVAVTELSARLLSVQYVTDNLGKEDLFDKRDVTSSNEAALSATVNGDPPIGTYQFTPIRTVQNQQLLSSGVRSDTEPLGGGSISFRYGDDVERSLNFDLLNGGAGIQRGSFRITDRSGASAEINLATAQSVDDVIEAVNNNTRINVTAEAYGDRLRLIDHTGQSVSNLKVQEIGRGQTAESLGLKGIDVAADSAVGADLLRLSEDFRLEELNDGTGVYRSKTLFDATFKLRDGTTGTIDFSKLITGSSENTTETTLGEMLDVINEAAPGKLSAQISADGDRLVLNDLTEGDGEFEITSPLDSTAMADLGLDGPAVDGQIVGRRLIGGLKTVLLSSLNGGKGLGELGALELTDRSGASETISLADAETLQDVVHRINAADIGIEARVNKSKLGIELVDTTGAVASNMIVANADGTDTADKLQIAADTDAGKVDSGSLDLQVVSMNTRLDDLNGGRGVARGVLTILDSKRHQDWLDLSKGDFETVGDVIRGINRMNLRVQAELNDSGDGILIRDLAGGTAAMRVADVGSTTARDLHLTGGAELRDFGDEASQVIDGSITHTVQLDADDSLDDLRQKINAEAGGLQAMTFVDGSSKPFRLSISATRGGEAGEMVIDTSGLGIDLQETNKARDALMVLGQQSATGNNVLISSSTNKFNDVVSGLSMEIKQPSIAPVTITVERSDTELTANVETMVTNYNKLRKKLKELTAYDVETNKRSLLTGDAAALRLDSDLGYLLSSRFPGTGDVQSLGELGISFKDDGTLSFDKTKLQSRFAEDPEAVRDFFTEEDSGFSDKFHELSEQLAGQDVSLLAQRFITLRDKIARNREKIADWDKRLEDQTQQLYMDFYRMETAIGKMQSNMSALSSIQPVAPYTGSGGSGGGGSGG
jgi:flagellar hook-associated protein 2